MEENTMSFPSMGETADGFLKSDFDQSGFDRRGLEEDMSLIQGLADERDLKMLNQDIGDGRALGNSKTVIGHVRQAAQQVRRMIDDRTGDRGLYKDNGLTAIQQGALRGEAQTLLKKALMNARAEWIQASQSAA